MAIVINGSGTVTGISVGGLPDGIVDAGTLATNSVDSAELIDGAVDASHMATTVSWGAKMASAQTISHNSWTNPVLDTELWDTGGAYSTANYRFTVPSGQAGYYYITASMEMTSVTADKIVQISIRKNGSAQPGSSQRDYTVSGDDDDIKFAISTVMTLAEGDYVEMMIYQNSGGDQDIASGETFFGGARI